VTPHPNILRHHATGSGPVVSAVLYSLIRLRRELGISFQGEAASRARKAPRSSRSFWDTRNLAEVSRACAQLAQPLARLHGGYEELLRPRTRRRPPPRRVSTELAGVANVERAMSGRDARTVELEKLLTFLPPARALPLHRLFGTVWGIMNSFVA